MRYVVWTAIALICPDLCGQSPPRNPEFEVASIKPARNHGTSPVSTTMRELLRASRPPGFVPMDDPGRIRLEDWTLLDLIAAAYRVRATQVSGPAWLADQGFDIEAKLPDGTPKDELNAMLQSLLGERFGLKVHRGQQTKQGFALTVGKNGPKLKPEEPSPTPEEFQQQAQARMTANQKLMQENREQGTPLVGFARFSSRSMTTDVLAFQLARLAEAPVSNETGLTGRYSVSIETWKNTDVPGGSVFDAAEKLGLKLEPRKVIVETVVVDQVSKTPAAN
jgi:uncharacterized protein (TIGR03435 family)